MDASRMSAIIFLYIEWSSRRELSAVNIEFP